MKGFFLSIVISLSFSDSFCQVQEFYVRPEQTDAAYPAQDSHFIVWNTTNQLNKLMLFIGGTFSSPKQYDYFCRHAAGLGFDVVSITYPNSVLTTLLAGSTDSLSFDKFRQEICFGTPVSPAVNVDSLNCIYTRTLKLVQFLTQLSSNNWGQYLASPDSLDWSKIAVSGHSQGSGHACYFAKKFSVERVVMFAGPNDYSTYFNNSAPWLRQSGVTPIEKHFVFLHLRDEIVPFDHQLSNIAGLTMLQDDDTTLVETNLPPYNNSKCLYSNLQPNGGNQYHNSVVIYPSTPRGGNDEPLFQPVWDYMLLNPFILSAGRPGLSSDGLHFRVYPNPVAALLTVDCGEYSCGNINIYDVYGQKIFCENISERESQIDVKNFPAGIYYFNRNGKSIPFLRN